MRIKWRIILGSSWTLSMCPAHCKCNLLCSAQDKWVLHSWIRLQALNKEELFRDQILWWQVIQFCSGKMFYSDCWLLGKYSRSSTVLPSVLRELWQLYTYEHFLTDGLNQTHQLILKTSQWIVHLSILKMILAGLMCVSFPTNWRPTKVDKCNQW